MLLTERYLEKLLDGMRESLSDSAKTKLIHSFGNACTDSYGYVRDYTEQDIYENVRRAAQEEYNKKILSISFNTD